LEASDIPATFAAHMRDVYGEKGAAWLAVLPAIVAACAERWSMDVGEPFELSYNYVAACERDDGTEAVLKVGYPHKELFTEMAALRHFGGRGMVALLESDDALGAMLLERLRPGEQLDGRGDEVAATSAVAGVMRNFWRPLQPGHGFPATGDWGKGFGRLRAAFDGGTGPFPEALFTQAEELFMALNASAAGPVLLHGDLHRGNILSAGRAPWVAIDPKGLAGEPAYETGAILRDPEPGFYERPDRSHATRRRALQLADELGFDRERVRGWGFAQAVLSAVWTWEDHGHVGEYAMECASFLADGWA
jgi:streptomycin 6-kinase